jgi:hypothetical protein
MAVDGQPALWIEGDEVTADRLVASELRAEMPREAMVSRPGRWLEQGS